MSWRLPRVARRSAPAMLPPAGLPGLPAEFSRIVEVPVRGGSDSPGVATESAAGSAAGAADGTATSHSWHILDTGDALRALDVEPVGTLLCVHGNPTWSYLWRSLATGLTDAAAAGSPAWRVIAVDQLEMGFSERTGQFRPLARRVRDLGDLTDALGLTSRELTGPVVTIGHDWGGVVSLGWAVDHPQLAAGTILLNTAVHQPEGHPIPAPLRVALTPGVLDGSTVFSTAFIDTTLSLAHPALDRATKDAYRAPYLRAARRGGVGGFVADIPAEETHQSRAELDRIALGVTRLATPALFLWGPRDPIFSDRYLNDLIERMPGADVHRFEGAGHLVIDDVDLAPIVLDWLGQRVPGAAEAEPVAADPEADPTAEPSTEPTAPFVPLWSYLDANRNSDDLALAELARGTLVSWRQLNDRVESIATGLFALGVRPGDRISLLVPPGATLTAVLYACLRIGAVVVVADAGLGLRGLTRAVRGAWPKYIIGAQPGLLVARAAGWPGIRIATVSLPAVASRALGVTTTLAGLIERGESTPLPAAPGPDALAAVLFTSGSTGPAKGVRYSHRQLAGVRDALATQYGVGPGTGLVAGFAPFALLGPALGARSATPDMSVSSPRTLTAPAVAAAVRAVQGTVLFLSPAALANVVATSGDLDQADREALAGVSTFLSAGAPVPAELLAAACELMPAATAHSPYGMTEGLLLTDISLDGIRAAAATAVSATTAVSALSALSAASAADTGICVGVPAASARVLVSALDAEGRASGHPSDAPGVTGEIVVSAPHLKSGYDRLWVTDRLAVRETPPGRWHRTGDVGHLDAAGRLWVEGRLPHIITTPGGVVTPVGHEREIEAVDRITRAAVVGVGPAGSQHLVAIVETDARRPSLAPAGLAAQVRAACSLPLAAVLAVPLLPTDIRHNSKIDRSRLAAWAGRVLSGARMTRP